MTAELPKIMHILGDIMGVALENEKELEQEWVELIKRSPKIGTIH